MAALVTGSPVPDEYVDPITLELMSDPVLTADGHTYERAAIERWLADHNTSPKTGLPLPSKDLIPNYALRNAIQRFEAEVLAAADYEIDNLKPVDPKDTLGLDVSFHS